MHSRFSLGGTLALAAAALVTAGISPGAQAAGDKGRLRLQLGTDNQFVYEARHVDSLGNVSYAPTTPPITQPFGPAKKGCLLEWLGGSQLAILTPSGGANALSPGFGPTSIGVFDGPNGTPCSRVSQSPAESLAFALGLATTSPAGTIGANAYDRLELDIEVKKDAALELVTSLGGMVTGRFHLQTGMSITGAAAPPKSDGQPVDSSPSTPVVACSARSDSGPDSGPNDNCRWVIKDIIGDRFVVRPLVGEFSLEGGGDWEGTTLYSTQQSFVYLTSVEESYLSCGGHTGTIPIGDGPTGATCHVDAAPDIEGLCPSTNVHYFLRDIAGTDQGCEFIKDAYGQLAASMTTTFPPEPPDLNFTEVVFPSPTLGSVAYAPGLCTGTVVGLDDNPTIAEVLTGPTRPAGYVDVVPETTGVRDWACILDQTVKQAPPGYPSTWIQVTQRILFWGDIQIIRQTN
jgi:hypothetical protein